MLSLNLLSDQKKDELKRRLLLELFTSILEVLLVLNIFAAIILLAAKIVLQNNFNEIIAQSTLITTSYTGVNQEIARVNRQIKQIEELKKVSPSWSDALFHITASIPPEIKLTNLTLNSADKAAVIAGTASTRAALLLFIKTLEDSGVFEKVHSPLSNIFEKTNISFTLNANLNMGYITAPHQHD